MDFNFTIPSILWNNQSHHEINYNKLISKIIIMAPLKKQSDIWENSSGLGIKCKSPEGLLIVLE